MEIIVSGPTLSFCSASPVIRYAPAANIRGVNLKHGKRLSSIKESAHRIGSRFNCIRNKNSRLRSAHNVSPRASVTSVPETPVTLDTPWILQDVVDAQQFSRETLSEVFEEARRMENIKRGCPDSQMLSGYLMSTLFYEPSTRTRLSFESAMKRLGGEVVTTENAREFSSASKGETLSGWSH